MSTPTSERIRTSHGEAVRVNGMPTGQLYGSGYGQNAECSALADRAAVLLAAAFPFPRWAITKRGNSSGRDAGAFIDFRTPEGGLDCIGISARKARNGRIVLSAMFPARYDSPTILKDLPELRKGCYWGEPVPGCRDPYGQVYRSGFAALEDARDWLTKWTAKHLPTELTANMEE